MRRGVAIAACCMGLAGCHKKQQNIATPAPLPPKPATSPSHPRRRVVAQRAPQPEQPVLGEFVEPSRRPALLAQIDADLAVCSARLAADRSRFGGELVSQIESIVLQAKEARNRNQLLTAERLASRALALTK